MRRTTIAGTGSVLILLVVSTLAVTWAQSDLETRAKRLEGKIMAPCCMSNPVSDHFSGSADEIRRQIRVMLREGRSEQEILDHFVREHGEQILALPKAEGFNLAAYLLPGAGLIAGVVALFLVLKRWQGLAAASGSDETSAGHPAADAVDPEMLARIDREVRERS